MSKLHGFADNLSANCLAAPVSGSWPAENACTSRAECEADFKAAWNLPGNSMPTVSRPHRDTALMKVACWSHTDSMPVACRFHAGCMPVPCRLHAGCMPVPCRLHTVCILFACCLHAVCMLFACCLGGAETLRASGRRLFANHEKDRAAKPQPQNRRCYHEIQETHEDAGGTTEGHGRHHGSFGLSFRVFSFFAVVLSGIITSVRADCWRLHSPRGDARHSCSNGWDSPLVWPGAVPDSGQAPSP
jgi:hypothetical protein